MQSYLAKQGSRRITNNRKLGIDLRNKFICLMSYIRKIRKMKFELIRRCHLAWYNHVFKQLAGSKALKPFRCNICGLKTEASLVKICDREISSCTNCGSNLRMRSVIHLLSLELFGESITLPEFPGNKDIYGLGMSDREEYAEPLSKKFSYINTYYHKPPKFDITCVDARMYKKFDFVISCDVFEHVKAPTILAFSNLRKILKDDGIVILTIPYMLFENTWEHFPELNEFKIVEDGMGKKLINTTIHGEQQEFTNLSFHGGQGATLELRVFTKSSIKHELKKSGFRKIEFSKCYEPRFGIAGPINWSLPITARP